MGNSLYYVTTPIYYVNAEPHLGHTYTTLAADTFARYHELVGDDAFFLTGTDEHGDKIARAATEQGTTPQLIADRVSALFRKTWKECGISFDRFIRTTDPQHVRTVKYVLQKVFDKGEVYKAEYGGYYCFGCERYFTQTELDELEDKVCPDHKKPLEYVKEENYFFKMSKYRDALRDYIESHPGFIRPERYKNEVLGFLKEPLDDLCISRPKSRLTWGIELPFDKDFVTYVWFDALLNYLTGIGYPDDPDWKVRWAVCEHIIGKDILKTHAVYWPTMLMAAGVPLFKTLSVHGFWKQKESKIAKSTGNVVRPLEMKAKYGMEAFRYYLLKDMVFGLDASYSEEALVQRVNADLANNLGNMVNRVLNMAEKYVGGIVPQRGDSLGEVHEAFKKETLSAAGNVMAAMEEIKPSRALDAIIRIADSANRYIVATEPFRMVKDDEKKEELEHVLYNLLECIRIIGILLSPFLPRTSKELLSRVGWKSVEGRDHIAAAGQFGLLQPGSKVYKGGPLFDRLEITSVTNDRDMPKESDHPAALIDFDLWEKLDLRIGLVKTAEPIPKSKKLLKLQVDIGEVRTVVAGMAKYYAPEELVGKSVVVLANLKPAKLMGIESRGMVLAVVSGGRGSVLTTDRQSVPGSKVS
ncbi:MAG: methionine--tRNA ligase [Deltaproteobacteria bacterium]|nr:methionine--tRNA ligase [Deltaproteobacteria bacterium]